MEKLMKPAEYAKELGISRQAVYAKIKRGILTAKNVDSKLYIVVDKEALKEKAPAVSESKKRQQPSLLLPLQKSSRQISTTLRGEVDLLKEAFHEMHTLYVHQLEHKESGDAIDVEEHEPLQEEPPEKEAWIGIKKLFKQLGITKEKKQEKLEKSLKKPTRRAINVSLERKARSGSTRLWTTGTS